MNKNKMSQVDVITECLLNNILKSMSVLEGDLNQVTSFTKDERETELRLALRKYVHKRINKED